VKMKAFRAWGNVHPPGQPYVVAWGSSDQTWYNHDMSQVRAKLSQIVDAIEMSDDQIHAFFDRQAGEVQIISEEDIAAAEDEELAAEAPDWQQDLIAMARQIEAGPGDRFMPLPDQFDAHEWEMMSKFAFTIEDEAISGQLEDAVHGAGAFRRFKDSVHRLGISDQWYAFRDSCYRRLAIDWCKDNGIEWESDDG